MSTITMFLFAGIALAALVLFAYLLQMHKVTGVIFIAGLDAFFWKPPTGKTAGKCMRLSPRSIVLGLTMRHYPNPPVIVTYKAVDPAHLEYLKVRVFGGAEPIVLHPKHIPDGPLSLARAVRDDPVLMSRLEALVRNGYALDAIAHNADFVHLAKEIRAATIGTKSRHTRKGLIKRLNDKKAFWDWCYKRHVPVNLDSFQCRGIAEIRMHAEALLREDRTVILKLSVSAGGLGNVKVRDKDELYEFLQSLDPSSEWCHQTVLVEGLVEIERQVASVIRVGPFGPRFVTHVERRVINDLESEGVTTLCPLPDWLENRMRQCIIRYGWHVWRLGYRGPLDIDWGILNCETGFIAFESNARWLATDVPLALLAHVNGGQGLAMSCDYLPVGHGVGTGELLNFLQKAGLQQVVITNPPTPGSPCISYVVLGTSEEEVKKADAVLRVWAKRTHTDTESTASTDIGASGGVSAVAT